MRKIIQIGILGMFLCGCRTTVCRSTGGMEVVLKEGGKTEVTVDDTCFSDWLDVETSSVRRVDSGCMKAQVSIRNKKKDYDDDGRMDDFAAQYRFSWLEADGSLSGSGERNWFPVRWHGGEVKPLESVSPNPSVTGFRLSIRHLR